MSYKRKRKRCATQKCAYCGRENVPVTKKGYQQPHVKQDGRPCLHVMIPFPEKITK